MKTILLLVLAVLVFAQVPFNVHHLHAMKRVGTPVADPKGVYLVYTVRYWNETLKKSQTNLDIYEIQTGKIRTLTWPGLGTSDGNPAFSADGSTVAFLRRGQIYAVPSTGSESDVYQVSNLPVDISGMKYSASGSFVVFSADVFWECDTLACTAQRDEEIAKRGPNSGTVYDQLFVRHWDTWLTPGKVSHLFVLPVSFKGKFVANQDPVDLMPRWNANSPVPPFGGTEQFDISPDGTEVALTVELIQRNTSWTTGWQVYTVQVSNPANSRVLVSYQTNARCQNPAYSPDGSVIAFLAMSRPGLESDKLAVWEYTRATRGLKAITTNVDTSFQSLTWLPDGSGYISDADNRGSHPLYVIRNGQPTILIPDGHNTGATFVGNSKMLALSRDFSIAPADIWVGTLIGSSLQGVSQVTAYNKALLSSIQMSTPVSLLLPPSESVQGWYWPPIRLDTNKTYPLALLIHGGPEGAWTDSWSFRWNPQLWAARGYAVIAINPPGSSGFGQNYQDKVMRNWGGVPYQALLAGVDDVVKRFPYIQGNNVCACGASYGGYMINWINSQTNRFKCLVCHDGVFDTLAMGYATEELWFTEAEFGGTPWNNIAGFEQYNPRVYVNNMVTPQLIIHGGRDYRIPVSEGLSAFTALQRRGIPSKFLYFDQENHWVLNPSNGIIWYDTVLGWLDQWTENTPPQ